MEVFVIMSGEIKVIRINQENLYVKREGKYLLVYEDKACLSPLRYKGKINIPLFYKIALYTKARRSYKSLLTEFFDELKSEDINRIKSRESLKKAGSACGRYGGGLTAFLLGIFCRYYDKHPRNINVVGTRCENCKNKDISICGSRVSCEDIYGCGKGVFSPLDAEFNVEDIPKLRIEIETEKFKEP
jgi:hypothetical protein